MEEELVMADKTEGTKTATRAANARAADKAPEQDTVIRGEQGATLDQEPELTATGADVALTPVDGEKRPADYSAGEELFGSATYRHTHGVPPADQRHELADY